MFLALEGPDGVGKSTLAAALAQDLGAHLTQEPTRSAIGLAARAAMLRSMSAPDEDARTQAIAEAFGLFTADRIAHDREIAASIDAKHPVVVDRYALSTWAYQTSQMIPQMPMALKLAYAAARTPTLTVLLLASDTLLQDRIAARGQADAADAAVKRTAHLYRQFAAELRPRYLDAQDGNANLLRSPYVPGNFLVLSAHASPAVLLDTLRTTLALPPFAS